MHVDLIELFQDDVENVNVRSIWWLPCVEHSSSFSCRVVWSCQHWNACYTAFSLAIEPSRWALNRRWRKHSAICLVPFSLGRSSIAPVKHGYVKHVDWNTIVNTTITSAWQCPWPCWVVDFAVYRLCSARCHGMLTFEHRIAKRRRRRRNSLNIRRCRSDCQWIPLTVDTCGSKKSLFTFLVLVIFTSTHFRLWTLQSLFLMFCRWTHRCCFVCVRRPVFNLQRYDKKRKFNVNIFS